MKGRCHCGAVEVTVPAPPRDVTECGCTLCRRYGGLWAYYPVADVTIEGPTDAYVWGRKYIAHHRCASCGCVMAWVAFDPDYPECGVNARMLEDFDVGSVPRIVEADASE